MADSDTDEFVSAQREVPGSLRPVTVKQLLQAEQPHPGARFAIDNIGIDRISCVASVIEMYQTERQRVWYLEDGSKGRIKVMKWIGGQDSQDLFDQIHEHRYIHVIGTLESYHGINQLVAFHVRPVLDMHEPFYHLLEAMVATLYYDRGPIPQGTLQGIERGPSPSQNLSQLSATEYGDETTDETVPPPSLDSQSQRETEEDRPRPVSPTPALDSDDVPTIELSSDEDDFVTVPPQSPSPSPDPEPDPAMPTPDPGHAVPEAYARHDPYSYLSPLHRAILLQIQNNDHISPNGVSVKIVARGLEQLGASPSQIQAAIEELMDNGLIYTTTDESHLKVVD
ncbi:nucleic acid-binding protein [Artomyces pyxidatus]|uniref:Nucleic acid-binding protein n=1 Tax=Artomyces pyxidatus TaxID=48021 RepID=A0ACB8TAC0_9AGAM|nr:nucleic acid-binding protein [Artomyces pyxidatus]